MDKLFFNLSDFELWKNDELNIERKISQGQILKWKKTEGVRFELKIVENARLWKEIVNKSLRFRFIDCQKTMNTENHAAFV